MRIAGKVNVPPITIDGEKVTEQPIGIEFDATFEVGEVKEMLSLVQEAPDVLANTFRKVLQYEKEFSHTENVSVDEKEAKDCVAATKE
jgi:hypothetical protein